MGRQQCCSHIFARLPGLGTGSKRKVSDVDFGKGMARSHQEVFRVDRPKVKLTIHRAYPYTHAVSSTHLAI